MNLIQTNGARSEEANDSELARRPGRWDSRAISMRFSHRGPSVFGVVAASLLTCAVCAAAERVPEDARKLPTKEPNRRAPVISESVRPLKTSYSVGRDELTLTITSEDNENVAYVYTARPEPVSPIKPQQFHRMWGTPEGTAAIARMLADLIEGQPVELRRGDSRGGTFRGQADGVAIFEEGGVTHVVTVRFEGNEAVFEDFGGVAIGCSATTPGGGCGCSASGIGSACGSWTDPSTGHGKAQCTDGEGVPSRAQANCDAHGGSCSCVTTAAQ